MRVRSLFPNMAFAQIVMALVRRLVLSLSCSVHDHHHPHHQQHHRGGGGAWSEVWHFFFCYFPWYKKKDPNGWHACPVKLIWVSQWWGLAWLYLAEIYHALAHLLPSYLVWLVLVCGIILLLFSILLTHCRTLLYISPSTYKYSQWWHQVYYVDQNRIVGYVPYMLNGEWPGFDSPDSPADIFDFKVYLRPQTSLAIGATIPRHFTRIINSNADVVFCFLVLASRYGWYDIRLDFCFTNSLWGCS